MCFLTCEHEIGAYNCLPSLTYHHAYDFIVSCNLE